MKISVSKHFYEKTKKDNKLLWVGTATIQKLAEGETGFRVSEKWIIRYLFRHPLDVVDLPVQVYQAIKKIQEAREKNKLVIFAGAGVSVDSGAPLWRETGTEILRSLGLSESTNVEAPVIGQWLFNERGEKEYNEKLREILKYHEGLQPNPIHRQLLRLRPRHLITTNYDDLLEKALKELQKGAIGKSYTIIRRDEDLPYAVSDEYIVKMHGDWDVMNFVFKEDDYLNYSRNFPLIESFVKGIFSSHLVLFVGFSFSDPNLKQIVNWVKEILGKDFQPAYLFQTKEPKPHETDYFGKKGIRPVVFDDTISNYLEEMDDNHKVVGKSEAGRKTYDFLRMLEVLKYRNYDWPKRAKSQHILDQMHESLLNFDAFNCIPPHSFKRLFPFSPTSLHPGKMQLDAEHDLGYHLQTSNEEIISLMQNLEFKNNRILIKEGSGGEKEIEQVVDFENKLAYIFDKLRSSQIHCIQRKGDGNNHNRILYGTQFDEKLLFSQWLNCQYKPMLESIYSREWESSGHPAKPLRERLLDASMLARFHFFLEAYTLYSIIGTEALQRQDYPVFFICQYNKKYLGSRVLRIADWKKYPPDLVGQIRDEMDTIDLCGLLKTMQAETEVKDLLNEVLFKELLDRYTRAIKKAHKGVLYYYDFFQHPGNQSSGTNDAHDLVEKYMTLHWVFHSNGILFGWDEYKFVELTEMAFEGMVASVCSSERNRGRLEEVEVGVLNLACHFLDTKQMEKILCLYKPEILPVKSRIEKERIVALATDWFSSCFEEGIFSFEPRKNNLLLRYLNDKVYVCEVEQLSNNFFLLFSYFDFEELAGSGKLNQLIDTLLKALIANFDGRSGHLWEVKYFVSFLKRNIKFFNHAQIEWAIKVITQTQGWKHGFGSTLARILKKEEIDFQLTDKPTMTDFFAQSRNEKREVEEFVHLYPFLSEELQKVLGEIVRELPNGSDTESLMLWMLARHNGMFSEAKELSKTQLEVFQKYFDAIEKIKIEKDGTRTNWRDNFAVNGPYWLAMLNYKSNVGLGNKTVQILLKLKSLPASLRWMLDPKGFDCKDFNCYWVFFYDGAEVLSKIGAMKIAAINKAFEIELKKEFSAKLAEVYHKYFV
ncbi:MAG: SIR2 family protein [Lewinellaceae bacterium]|nr:SIR2 family protein [Saprospiraceae bacterium]MCB9341785.1 SIR2 family protein [Lewinellaceae bacterium]